MSPTADWINLRASALHHTGARRGLGESSIWGYLWLKYQSYMKVMEKECWMHWFGFSERDGDGDKMGLMKENVRERAVGDGENVGKDHHREGETGRADGERWKLFSPHSFVFLERVQSISIPECSVWKILYCLLCSFTPTINTCGLTGMSVIHCVCGLLSLGIECVISCFSII